VLAGSIPSFGLVLSLVTQVASFVGVSHKHAWSKELFDPSKGLAKKRGQIYTASASIFPTDHILQTVQNELYRHACAQLASWTCAMSQSLPGTSAKHTEKR
jgi:hypothetical protein